MRTDPTDNGGLFVGRRPGTRPVRYRETPQPATGRRRRIDHALATLILAVMVIVAASFWGPIPAAWLWVGAQVQYHSDSVSLGLVVAFLGMLLMLMAGLVLLKRLDGFWILVRRAAGNDQRSGMIGPVFAVAAAIAFPVFVVWFLGFGGAAPSIAPSG